MHLFIPYIFIVNYLYIWFGNRQHLIKHHLPLSIENFPSVVFNSSVLEKAWRIVWTTFSERVANLTSSSYFHLRWLRDARVFTSIVHAFVCSRIDYCNSLRVSLPEVRLTPLQPVLNSTARAVVARLPRKSHIFAFMLNHLHRLPLIARIQLKVLILIYRSHTCQSPGIYVTLSPSFLCRLFSSSTIT